MPLDLSDGDLEKALKKHDGNMTATAVSLGVSRSTLRSRAARSGITREPRVSRVVGKREPRITRDMLAEAIQPANNCPVKRFLDYLDEEQRAIFNEGLGYDRKDLSAGGLRQLALAAGYKDEIVPGTSAINAHRTGQRPCRCKD